MVTRLYALLAALATAACGAAQLPQQLRLEAQLEPAQVYVQSQAVYRLRLYQAIDARDLQLVGPSSRLADLRPIGAVRVYETLRDGRRYRVHEQSYAVFPFASGALRLDGAHASLRVALPGARATDGRQALRIDAPPQTLTVLPAAGSGHWLPARSLALSEAWADAPGGAQRRTVRIEAAGVQAAQLPEPHFAADGLTVHAGPARLEDRFSGDTSIGMREQSFLVAPARTGELEVPALHVQWRDAETGAPMTASLPPRTLQHAASQPATSAKPAAAGLLLLLLPAAAAALRACRRRAAWRLLLACWRGDARAVRDGLLAWSAAVWPAAPPRTLGALAARLRDAQAQRAVANFERDLYGPPGRRPDRRQLRALVRQVWRGARRRAAMMDADPDDRDIHTSQSLLEKRSRQ